MNDLPTTDAQRDIDLLAMVCVACMVASYAVLGRKNHELAFAISWFLGAAALFIAGLWPVAVLQAVFGITALRKWLIKTRR